MAEFDATILNLSNSAAFNFRGVTNWKTKKSQGVISIPLIGLSAGSNLLFRFMGQQEEFSFDFALFDDGVSVTSGTTITIADQIEYLRENIYTSEYDTSWTLEQFTLAAPSPGSVTVVITNLDINATAGSPQLLLGSITMMRGTLLTL